MPDMKRTRKLVVVAAIATVIGIPGAAAAQGDTNCVGETAQVMHTAFPMLAKTGNGAVGRLLAGVREDPSGFPWCGGE
jgi:hypothetical protein